jgi:replicative superfamily II helicase
MSQQKEIIQLLNSELATDWPERISSEQLKENLSDYINHLIQTDFQKLIFLLYRIDISEPKLRALLNENHNADAGKIIADMIIERQMQKIKSRRENRRDNIIPDEDKW